VTLYPPQTPDGLNLGRRREKSVTIWHGAIYGFYRYETSFLAGSYKLLTPDAMTKRIYQGNRMMQCYFLVLWGWNEAFFCEA
jgi:hypothetical protein